MNVHERFLNNTFYPMESVLNIDVSCVPNYYTKNTPRNVTLLRWLTSAKYAAAIQQLRTITDKYTRDKMKARLPAITPSGQFTHLREDGLKHYSGFIQFDIDLKDNQHITNYGELKKQLANIRNIAYCGLSASGQGYWGLLRVAYPHRHLQHWQYLHATMQRFGIYIDGAPKSICSLRGYSYDAHAYFNHQAEKLYHYLTPPSAPATYTTPQTDNCATIQRIVAQVVASGKDITEGYNNWFSLGCCIAANFGKDGVGLFQELSQFHPTYTYDKTNDQYDKCLKHAKDTGIGVLVKRVMMKKKLTIVDNNHK